MEFVMILLVLGVCILGSQVSAASLTCRNEAAQSIDFWTSVKFPRPTGTRYTYTDNTLEQTEWMLGDDLAATSGNPLSATLAPLYADASFGYIMYNDEIPTSSGGSTSSTKAHAKGVIGFGPDGGFWLVHSVPKFPDRPSVSDYTGIASGQQINAQSFLCLSMTPSTLEKVAQLGVSVKEAELGWKNTVDHSKWCVTAHLAQADGNQVQVACVGDKNRADTQLIRGGGTVCFASNANVWKLYTSLIDLVESCTS
ncbi:hypothetical protein WJX84_004894 [Apatococcus fuscideae]|uniref:Uncharacterized protein n=1 Tax=Apatococcus fuscideae TaxID=2026836 RepID=A0AAW1S8L4_9CHLO